MRNKITSFHEKLLTYTLKIQTYNCISIKMYQVNC